MPTKKKTDEKKTDALDFDPALCIKQYNRLQAIGADVCDRLHHKFEHHHHRFKYVDISSIVKSNTVCIYHDCTWLEVPTKIVVQGVDAVVDYISKKYEAELAEWQRQRERAEKDRLKQERERNMEEYLRLKKKLGIDEGSENDD